MKKNYFLLLVAFMVTAMSYGQGSEDFANSNATGSYSDGSFVGNSGVTWTYVASRDANNDANSSGIALPALMLRRVANGSKVTSSAVAGGMGDFSVKLYKGFTGGGDRQVELYVNGVLKGTSTAFDDLAEHIFTVTGVNVGGNVIVELVNVTAKQVIVDDITWTTYAGAAVPALSINSPSEGDVLPSGDFNISYAISNFNIATSSSDTTQDGHMHWYFDGNSAAPNMVYDPSTADIPVTGLAAGAHTLTMELVDNSHAALSTPVTQTINFSVQSYTQVADIAALRAGTIGDGYELTGEALINYAQSYKHIKYIEDATAGIMIYDVSGNITAGVRGEGITNIKGILDTYQGMMQFKPNFDATIVATPTVTITPQVVTLATLATNAEDYEAELIKIEGVTLADEAGGDGNFGTGNVHVMTQGTDTFDFRTNFYSADYIGQAIPTASQDIVGLITDRTTPDYVFTARDLADFTATAYVGENVIDGLQVYPNPATGNVLNIRTANNDTKTITIYSVLGNKVFTTVTSDSQISLPTIKAGIYLLNVVENGQSSTMKLMIK
jgi:hypothetical protein